MTQNRFSGLPSVPGPRTALFALAGLATLGGCATVSVYEASKSAEISLTVQQSALHKAAEAYCDETRNKGLASGEATLGRLAGLLSGKSLTGSVYWRKIGGDKLATQNAVSRVRADLTQTTSGLTQLDAMAHKLMSSSPPTKTDVTQFERALIHARQARESLTDAFVQVNKRGTEEFAPDNELQPLDKALAVARVTADDLAAARATADAAAAKAQAS